MLVFYIKFFCFLDIISCLVVGGFKLGDEVLDLSVLEANIYGCILDGNFILDYLH